MAVEAAGHPVGSAECGNFGTSRKGVKQTAAIFCHRSVCLSVVMREICDQHEQQDAGDGKKCEKRLAMGSNRRRDERRFCGSECRAERGSFASGEVCRDGGDGKDAYERKQRAQIEVAQFIDACGRALEERARRRAWRAFRQALAGEIVDGEAQPRQERENGAMREVAVEIAKDRAPDARCAHARDGDGKHVEVWMKCSRRNEPG